VVAGSCNAARFAYRDDEIFCSINDAINSGGPTGLGRRPLFTTVDRDHHGTARAGGRDPLFVESRNLIEMLIFARSDRCPCKTMVISSQNPAVCSGCVSYGTRRAWECDPVQMVPGIYSRSFPLFTAV